MKSNPGRVLLLHSALGFAFLGAIFGCSFDAGAHGFDPSHVFRKSFIVGIFISGATLAFSVSKYWEYSLWFVKLLPLLAICSIAMGLFAGGDVTYPRKARKLVHELRMQRQEVATLRDVYARARRLASSSRQKHDIPPVLSEWTGHLAIIDRDIDELKHVRLPPLAMVLVRFTENDTALDKRQITLGRAILALNLSYDWNGGRASAAVYDQTLSNLVREEDDIRRQRQALESSVQNEMRELSARPRS